MFSKALNFNTGGKKNVAASSTTLPLGEENIAICIVLSMWCAIRVKR